MFIIIVFCLGCDRPSGLLFFVLTSFFVPSSSVSLSYFRFCCSNARVFGKTLVHQFPISYSHAEWYFCFPTVQLQVHILYLELKNINASALVNLYTSKLN